MVCTRRRLSPWRYFKEYAPALVLVLLFPTLAPATSAAADPVVQEKAASWLGVHWQEALTEAEQNRSALAQARAAIAQAESAVRLAQEYRDTAAEGVARNALDTAQQAKALAERRLAASEEAARRLKQALKYAAPERYAAAATRITGEVYIIAHDGRQTRWDGNSLLGPGAKIKIGASGRVDLATIDGGNLSLGPNSQFTLIPPPDLAVPPKGLPEKAADKAEAWWSKVKEALIEGPAYYHRNHHTPPLGAVLGAIEYRTPTLVAAVRGTEFELRSARNEPARLIPYSGKIDLAATSEARALKQEVWWLANSETGPALNAGELGRVSALRGEARVENAAGATRSAAPGAVLQAGERLVTGANGVAHLVLPGGYRVALAAGSRFDAGTDRASGAPLYALRRGRVHVWGDAAAGPRFLTPNTVTIPHAREFEIGVVESGAADYAVFDGALEITAIEGRLDVSKIDRWWEK